MLGGSDAIGKVSNIYCNLLKDLKMCYLNIFIQGDSGEKQEEAGEEALGGDG